MTRLYRHYSGRRVGDPDYTLRADLAPNGVINITDVFKVLPPVFGSSAGSPDSNGDTIPDYSTRADLAPNGVINITDVFRVLPPVFGTSWTP